MASPLSIGLVAAQVVHWVLLGLVAVAAVIGLLLITRGTAVRRVRGVGPDAQSLAPSEENFRVVVAILTGAPIVAGNSVDLVLDGGGFPRFWGDLGAARVSITIQCITPAMVRSPRRWEKSSPSARGQVSASTCSTTRSAQKPSAASLQSVCAGQGSDGRENHAYSQTFATSTSMNKRPREASSSRSLLLIPSQINTYNGRGDWI
jgi:hypothetical protein